MIQMSLFEQLAYLVEMIVSSPLTIFLLFIICGFGNWKACVSLVTGLLAKESIVSTLSVLYSGQNYKNITEIIMKDFSTASAFSFMIFSLLYTPCVAAISVIFREFTSKKYAIFSILYQIFLAYVLSALSYQTVILFQNIF